MAESSAIYGTRDADPNTIDIFYTPAYSAACVARFGDRGASIPAQVAAQFRLPAFKNVIVLTPQRGVLTPAHEILHILLNQGNEMHGASPWSLRLGGTTDRSVGGTKRIGPYGFGLNSEALDTVKIRSTTEALP